MGLLTCAKPPLTAAETCETVYTLLPHVTSPDGNARRVGEASAEVARAEATASERAKASMVETTRRELDGWLLAFVSGAKPTRADAKNSSTYALARRA